MALLSLAVYAGVIPVAYYIIVTRIIGWGEHKWPALYTPKYRENTIKQDKDLAFPISFFWPISLPIVIYKTRIKK